MKGNIDNKPERGSAASDTPKVIEATVQKPDARDQSCELADDDLEKVSGGMFQMNKHLVERPSED